MAAPAQAGPASRAFTLIELLAVLLIMALVAGLTLPNLSLRADRVVLAAAQDLAATFAFTRQRAVATAVPHRVVIDLDRADALEYRPLPGPFGRPERLREPVRIDSVETLAAGALREGQVAIVFEADGPADPALIVLANEDGDAYVLRLARLADEVRISHE